MQPSETVSTHAPMSSPASASLTYTKQLGKNAAAAAKPAQVYSSPAPGGSQPNFGSNQKHLVTPRFTATSNLQDSTVTSNTKTSPIYVKRELQSSIHTGSLPQTPKKTNLKNNTKQLASSGGSLRDPYAISSDSDSDEDTPRALPTLKSFDALDDVVEASSPWTENFKEREASVEAILRDVPAFLDFSSPIPYPIPTVSRPVEQPIQRARKGTVSVDRPYVLSTPPSADSVLPAPTSVKSTTFPSSSGSAVTPRNQLQTKNPWNDGFEDYTPSIFTGDIPSSPFPTATSKKRTIPSDNSIPNPSIFGSALAQRQNKRQRIEGSGEKKTHTLSFNQRVLAASLPAEIRTDTSRTDTSDKAINPSQRQGRETRDSGYEDKDLRALGRCIPSRSAVSMNQTAGAMVESAPIFTTVSSSTSSSHVANTRHSGIKTARDGIDNNRVSSNIDSDVTSGRPPPSPRLPPTATSMNRTEITLPKSIPAPIVVDSSSDDNVATVRRTKISQIIVKQEKDKRPSSVIKDLPLRPATNKRTRNFYVAIPIRSSPVQAATNAPRRPQDDVERSSRDDISSSPAVKQTAAAAAAATSSDDEPMQIPTDISSKARLTKSTTRQREDTPGEDDKRFVSVDRDPLPSSSPTKQKPRDEKGKRYNTRLRVQEKKRTAANRLRNRDRKTWRAKQKLKKKKRKQKQKEEGSKITVKLES